MDQNRSKKGWAGWEKRGMSQKKKERDVRNMSRNRIGVLLTNKLLNEYSWDYTSAQISRESSKFSILPFPWKELYAEIFETDSFSGD